MHRTLLCAALAAALVLVAFVPAAADPGAGTPNPVAGARFYVSPATEAARQASAWRAARPADAALLERIARQPAATWFGGWNRDVRADVDRLVSAAAAERALPVLVAYNIPQRDCGLHSSGGARNAAEYRRWVRALAAGIGGRPALVVLEPDATMVTDCLSAPRLAERLALLSEAVDVLKAAGATVYLDAGSPTWGRADEMAARLRAAGVERADGFALNVSNFVPTPRVVAAGEALSTRLGGARYVIDTSRNGAGTADGREWCNAPGQALGTAPTTRTGHPRVDAFLWIKTPGESDGTCNGGPAAGRWWPEYALGLARAAR